MSSSTLDFSKGAIFAVRCAGTAEDTTTFSVQLAELENIQVKNSFEFLDLAASAAPTAALKP